MSQIAWAAKVSPVFLDRVKWIVEDLQIGHNTADGMSKLLSCIAWETGRTFSASVVNKAGSGATGLIQFMPSTARSLGTTTSALARMTAEDQLNYVWKYFSTYKGKLNTLSDLYMAILWPKAVGKPETFVLWEKGSMPTTYRQNSGIDINRDGAIIKAEASAKLNAMLAEGMLAKNSAPYDASIKRFAAVSTVVEPEVPHVPETPVPSAPSIATASTVKELAKQLPRDTVNEVLSNAPATITEQVVEGTKLKLSEKSTWVGAALAIGAVVMDPNVQAAFGPVMQAVQRGNAFGILAAVAGVGLVILKSKTSPRTDSVIAAKRLIDPG